MANGVPTKLVIVEFILTNFLRFRPHKAVLAAFRPELGLKAISPLMLAGRPSC
jgi:hypothetical protein